MGKRICYKRVMVLALVLALGNLISLSQSQPNAPDVDVTVRGEAIIGETFSVSVSVTNFGSQSIYNVMVKIDLSVQSFVPVNIIGSREQRIGTLESMESERVEFLVAPMAEGIWYHTIRVTYTPDNIALYEVLDVDYLGQEEVHIHSKILGIFAPNLIGYLELLAIFLVPIVIIIVIWKRRA